MYWQNLVVFGVVTLALLAIARRIWRTVHGPSEASLQSGGPCGGGGCASCPVSRTGKEKQVVTLDSLRPASKQLK